MSVSGYVRMSLFRPILQSQEKWGGQTNCLSPGGQHFPMIKIMIENVSKANILLSEANILSSEAKKPPAEARISGPVGP